LEGIRVALSKFKTKCAEFMLEDLNDSQHAYLCK